MSDLKSLLKLMVASRRFQIGITLVIGLIIGSMLFSTEAVEAGDQGHTDHASNTIYTCSMHPQIRLEEPGQCPICFMDLIPLVESSEGQGPGEISLSETAVALAHISTTPVRKGTAIHKLRLAGRVDYDETRIKNISAWFPGRLERLYVDYTGIRVSQGDHLFDIYSTDLYAAQEELLQANRRLSSSSEGASTSARTSFRAAREKAHLLGLSESQINAILKQGVAQSTLQINSPITGVVTHKKAKQGSYVKTGDEIYTIVDLSHVWLILEAYEKDLPWLAYGQTIDFQVSGVPGKSFTAQISYIDPMVDPISRSVTVRAVLDNRGGDLKPGMLVQSQVSAHLNGLGQVINPALAGKWTCPMHPEVLKDKRGDCGICGMDLVPVRDVFGPGGKASEALLIPTSAVFKTGNRALVYVESDRASQGLYELREIVLGPRVENEYIILSGLAQGELVVTEGNFKIDSAMQISGKVSMMSPPETETRADVSSGFMSASEPLIEAYLELQANLAGDKLIQAQTALQTFKKQAGELDRRKDRPDTWVKASKIFRSASSQASPEDMNTLRQAFEEASKFVLALQKGIGHSGTDILYEAFCPMAFDNKGASWLQVGKQINNPYFGQSMLSCGEVTQTFMPVRPDHE